MSSAPPPRPGDDAELRSLSEELERALGSPAADPSAGVDPSPAAEERDPIGVHRRILGGLMILLGTLLFLFVGVGALVLGIITGLHIHEVGTPILIMGGGLAAALLIVAGVGFLQGRDWARSAMWLVAILILLFFPIGTALGIYAIWVLLRPGARR